MSHFVSCRSNIILGPSALLLFIVQALSPVESSQPPCHRQSAFPGTMDASEHSWLISLFGDRIRISSLADQETACWSHCLGVLCPDHRLALPITVLRSRSTYVKMLHSFDVLSGRLACFRVRIIEFASNEVPDMVSIEKKNKLLYTSTTSKDLLSNLIIITASATRLNLPHYLWFNSSVAYALHHGQMLQIIMRLKECIAREEFY